jgi:hypothetical protein
MMGILQILEFQKELARLIDAYVAPAESDYFVY